MRNKLIVVTILLGLAVLATGCDNIPPAIARSLAQTDPTLGGEVLWQNPGPGGQTTTSSYIAVCRDNEVNILVVYGTVTKPKIERVFGEPSLHLSCGSRQKFWDNYDKAIDGPPDRREKLVEAMKVLESLVQDTKIPR